HCAVILACWQKNVLSPDVYFEKGQKSLRIGDHSSLVDDSFAAPCRVSNSGSRSSCCRRSCSFYSCCSACSCACCSTYTCRCHGACSALCDPEGS
ncbi:MAG TPA: hypothetical protein VLS45_00550, partial [Methylomicrobium sp.]|nr:hypothetical protein [Methylomicrobium sp.]